MLVEAAKRIEQAKDRVRRARLKDRGRTGLLVSGVQDDVAEA